MIFDDIDGVTTLNDFEAAPNEDDPEFEDDDTDDRSYLTSDDQSIDDDNNLRDSFEPIEEQYDLEDAEEDPGVQFEEEDDNDALLEDLSDLGPPIEEKKEEPPNESEEYQAETEKLPEIEEIDEEEPDPQVRHEPEMIPEQDPEFSHLNGSYWAMGNQGRIN